MVVDPATGQVRAQPGAAALGQAQTLADLAGTAATTGQDAGAAGIAAAQNIANQMQATATAGQGAGTPFLQAAQSFHGGRMLSNNLCHRINNKLLMRPCHN